MGIFDFLKTKSAASEPPKGGDKNVARFAKAAAERLAQPYDRMDALENLSRIATPEATAALLRRFSFHVEPGTQDQEEKEVAFRGVLAGGKGSVEPVLAFCERAESLNWPIKILKQLLSDEEFVEEIIDLLAVRDTEYERNVDPKLHLLAALDGVKHEDARKEAERFLTDVSEPVRFQAVTTLLSAADEASVGPLAECAIGEESVRVCNKICEGLRERSWTVPAEHREALAKALSMSDHRLGQDGRIV